MSHRAKYLTHADRANRRAKIAKALASASPVEVAARFGMSARYVRQIAQDCGLSASVGRPKGTRAWRDCPPHLTEAYDHFIRRKRIPAAMARQVLEAA